MRAHRRCGLVNGHPALHIHGCVARKDGAIRRGRLVKAIVLPTLKLFLTESQVPKKPDASTDLELERTVFNRATLTQSINDTIQCTIYIYLKQCFIVLL